MPVASSASLFDSFCTLVCVRCADADDCDEDTELMMMCQRVERSRKSKIPPPDVTAILCNIEFVFVRRLLIFYNHHKIAVDTDSVYFIPNYDNGGVFMCAIAHRRLARDFFFSVIRGRLTPLALMAHRPWRRMMHSTPFDAESATLS